MDEKTGHDLPISSIMRTTWPMQGGKTWLIQAKCIIAVAHCRVRYSEKHWTFCFACTLTDNIMMYNDIDTAWSPAKEI